MTRTLNEYSRLKDIPYKTVATIVSGSNLEPVNYIQIKSAKAGVFLETDLDQLFKNYRPNLKSRKPRNFRDHNTTLESQPSQMAPFRNFKCPKYFGCLAVASAQKQSLLCDNCENRHVESQDWLENEMAC